MEEENRVKLQALRTLVAEKFAESKPRRGHRRKIGCEAVDGERGGLLEGAVTEVCGSSGAGQVLLSAMLDAAVRESFQLALVDGGSAFSPSDWPGHQLSRMLWVRCETARQTVKAADLLLRDGNLPLLIVDLQGLKPGELRRIPASTWHRFHRVIEPTASVLVILTSQPMVEGAASRIVLEPVGGLSVRLRQRGELIGRLHGRVFERGEFSVFTEASRKSA